MPKTPHPRKRPIRLGFVALTDGARTGVVGDPELHACHFADSFSVPFEKAAEWFRPDIFQKAKTIAALN